MLEWPIQQTNTLWRLVHETSLTMTELTGVLMSADLDAIQSQGAVDSFLDNTNREEQFNEAP